MGHFNRGRASVVTDSSGPRTAPIRLVVTDDHPVVLQGLQAMFSGEPDLSVVAACSSGQQTLEAVRAHRPDVLVLDLHMPGLDGLAVLKALHQQGIPPRTVVLTAEIDDDQTLEVVRLGAGGIVLKEMAAHFLIDCIRKVHAGRTLGRAAVSGTGSGHAAAPGSRARRTATCSHRREVDIVRMIALGLRNSRSLSRLSVSEGTVKSHLHHVYEKLGVNGRMGLLLLAQQKGLK